MLRSLRIKNFKALRDTGELEIKPLTFLLGPNSSGKTSLFQLLLALKQTARSTDISTPLILSGDELNLGSYRDIVWKHYIELGVEIEYKLMVHPHFIEKSTQTPFFFRYKFKSLYSGKKIGQIYLREAILRVTEGNDSKKTKKGFTEFKISRSSKGKYYYIESEGKPKERVELYSFYWPVFPLGKDFDQSLSTAGITQQIFFRQFLFHLGPLRQEPERVYSVTGALPASVGDTGRWVKEVLRFREDITKKVKYWFNEFDISTDFNLEELKKGSMLFNILLKDKYTKTEVNISDVGFGVSQLLPIIVQGFLAPQGSVLLIEQPEIHLHPKAQAKIGDLLIEIAKDDKGKFDKVLIVETHSDLILSRIGTRIAEDKLKSGDVAIKPEDVAIYYFDPSPDGTNVKRIKINEDGQYEDFPEGFFEERYDEAKRKADIIFSRE